jgi:Variant SH3 domain
MGTGEGSSYRVTTDYRAAYPDPIVMSAGETLRVGEIDPEDAGWVWCTGRTGKSGWVWATNPHGQAGWVPAENVERLA